MMKTHSRKIPSVREVMTYGNPVLREKAKPIARIDEAIRQLADDMLATMRSRNGVGLAAQQVGETVAICVIEVPLEPQDTEELSSLKLEDVPAPEPMILINPAIIETSGKETAQEGCLSFPEIYVSVARASELTASFKDLSGKERTIQTKGLLARIIQHELDHLAGVLLVDRMSPIKKITLAGKLKKLKKRSESAKDD